MPKWPPFSFRDYIAEVLGIDPKKIRVCKNPKHGDYCVRISDLSVPSVSSVLKKTSGK